MALFKTIDELVLFVPVMKSFDFDLVQPDIERAEEKWIIPIMGQAMYDELYEAYNTSTLTADETLLLKAARKPLAQLAFYLYAPKGNVNVGSSGIQQTHTENSKPAFQWASDQMLQSYFDGGYEGLDALQAFLDAHKDDFTTWATSDEYSESKELFVNTPKEFNKHFSINNSRRTFMAMRHILKRHNDLTIKDLLGADLWDEIKEQVIDEDVDAENETLLTYIRPALVHLTVMDALTELSVKFDEFGITIAVPSTSSTTQNLQARQPAATGMLNDLHRKEKLYAEKQLVDLRAYLEANVATYPLYVEIDEDEDPTEFENDDESGTALI